MWELPISVSVRALLIVFGGVLACSSSVDGRLQLLLSQDAFIPSTNTETV